MTESIIETTAPLRPAYTPETIVGRSEERDAITAAVDNQTPNLSNLYIHGPRGTGKTLLIKRIITELPDDVFACYVPCIEFDTHYKVLKRFYRALTGDQAMDGYHTSDLQRAIENLTTSAKTLLILDDVDFLLLNDGEDLLYFLSRLDHSPRMGIVLISSEGRSLQSKLEERTYSSFYPQSINFESYTGDTINEILSRRAEQAFTPRTLHSHALRYISSSTQNVTFGLHWFEAAARLADSVISESDAAEAREAAVESYVGFQLQEFSTHHQYLYQVIQDSVDLDKTIRSGTVYKKYEERCQSDSLATVSKRTISDYLKHLELLDLIHADYHYGGEEGKTRNIKLKQPL